MLHNNTVHAKIILALAKKYNLEDRVINAPTRYLFKFVSDVMSNPTDSRAVRLPALGVFVQKNTINKEIYYSTTKAA